MSRYTKEEREEATAFLRSILKPGDVMRTSIDHVSSSGMTRWIKCYVVKGGDIDDVSWYVARVVDSPFASRGHWGVERGGCGMDMGFDLVYSLSRYLFPDGFRCAGAKCVSNEHSNPPYPTREEMRGRKHRGDGGYALAQRWL